jgi:hypothetical protein
MAADRRDIGVVSAGAVPLGGRAPEKAELCATTADERLMSVVLISVGSRDQSGAGRRQGGTMTITHPTVVERFCVPADIPVDVARQRTGLNLVRVKDDLWRATVADGRILGHIERRDAADGTVFVAKRLAPQSARFHTLGEFWRIDDAMDCLHSL